MTLSWKLLFCMLERNDLIIKLFLDLYLVSIYVEYMYMCIHMCIMNEYKWLCIYIFMFNLLFGSFPILILSFNNAYQFYLQLLLLWSWCNIIRMRYRTVYWLGLRIDICMYKCIYDNTTLSLNPLVLCFWR